MKDRANVYEIIQSRILSKLEAGVVPWHKPWRTEGIGPTNLVTKRPYRGVNVWLLSGMDYERPYWLTYKQAEKLGGQVIKGSQGMPVIFWKWIEKDPSTPDEKPVRFPLLRYYTVFNVAQVEGIADKVPAPPEKVQHDQIKACDDIVAGMPNRPAIIDNGPQASYCPLTDTVRMPAMGLFERVEDYYGTLFHELVHSTGHASRLGRVEPLTLAAFGSGSYGREELVAEMGAAMLCGVAGIERTTLDNSASYIDNWRKAIGSDTKLVVMAGAQAQKASDYILGVNREEEN